ncbi:replication-relaxation family protein [Bacillus sp. FJAT-45037]|uniref:replication-relaxation family protein n=1 Tax=Bacillus sp. FJAT-45037 TaxID=2011007 RepID=UPI000C247DEE|nr:replication-relaxation family protein [Bacillus sp. FJAT-45037]
MEPIKKLDKRIKVSRWWKGTVIKEVDIYSFLIMNTFREVGSVHVRNILDPAGEKHATSFSVRLRRQGERMYCKVRIININRPQFRLTMISLAKKGYEVLSEDLKILESRPFKTQQPLSVSLHRLTMLDAVSKMIGAAYQRSGIIMDRDSVVIQTAELSTRWFIFESWEAAALETVEEGEHIFPVAVRRVEDTEEYIYLDLQCINPYLYPYVRLLNGGIKTDETIIKPDWILKLNERVINIEIDTGTENLNRLKEKLDDYRLLLNEAPYKKFDHSIYFICADETARAVNVTNKIQRIRTMKRTLSEHPTFIEEDIELFILPLKRAGEVFQEHNYNVSGIRAQHHKTQFLRELFEGMKFIPSVTSKFYFEFEQKKEIEEELSLADYELLIKRKSKDREFSYIAILYMQEGSVRDYVRLKNLNQLTQDSRFDVEVYAIYNSHDSIEYDGLINSLPLHERVFLTSIEDLSNVEGDYKIYTNKLKVVPFI